MFHTLFFLCFTFVFQEGLPQLVNSSNSTVKAAVNGSAELPCEGFVENDKTDLAYVWLQNGLRINMNKQHRLSVGKQPGYLRIENITLAEAGIYHCIVKTPVAKIYQSTELVVLSPPGAPGAVLAENLTSTSGTIHFSDGSANGDPITAYTIEGRTNHNGSWVVLKENVEKYEVQGNGRKRIDLVNVLSPWSTYSFRVSAVNAFGKGEPSDPSPLYNTGMDVPHVAPSNVGGGGGKFATLTITWNPLPPQEWNAPNVWYNVSYKPAESDVQYKEISLKIRRNIGLVVVNVGYGNYYIPYLVKVQAINDLGPGPYSKEKLIYSAEEFIQVFPTGVKGIHFNSTAFNATWAPLDLSREKIRGELLGYRIKYWEFRKYPENRLSLLKRGSENWALIGGLQPNTEYFFTVTAYNAAGYGIESESHLGRTFKAAPLRPPTNVVIKAMGNSSASVAWEKVVNTTDEEPIKGYKVRYWEAGQDMTSYKEVEHLLDDKDLKIILSNLTLGKVYKLTLLAFSNGGDGKMSSVSEFKLGCESNKRLDVIP